MQEIALPLPVLSEGRASVCRLAIITTHPIQYYAPVFQRLAASALLEVKVFYTCGQQNGSVDRGFGKQIEWDIPLLKGYDYCFLKNAAKNPGSHHFRGIENPNLIGEVNHWGANAIMVFGWSNASHLKAIRYFQGKIPVYFRGDSHLLDERPGWKKQVRRVFLRWVYRHIDYAFYVGSCSRAYFLKHNLKPEHLIFAPHAIDNARFTDVDGKYQAQAREWRKEIGITPEQRVLLFCGKFEDKKDPRLLLQVAKQYEGNEDLIFLFIGNGHLEEQMKTEASALKNVRFLGFQNQSRMPLVYRLGDVYILPSQGPGETWGLAVNEAMACGRPVIVSHKVGCAVDLVRNGENGYIFPAGDAEALATGINQLLNQDLQQVGQRSSEIIAAWNFEALVQSIEQTIVK